MLILLVIGVGSLLGGANLLLLVFGLMAGPFMVGGQVTLLVLKWLRVTRVLPDHGLAGQKFFVRVTLANRKPFLSAWMIVAADTVSNPGESVESQVLFTRIPPREEREALYAVYPARRGRYRFGPLRVKSSFPFGLIERSFEVGDVQEMVVFPRIGSLTSAWRHGAGQGNEPFDRAVARLGMFEDEFDRLREHRSGDNTRTIHWRTTARRNELMVRENRRHRESDLWVVLDLWQPEHPADEDLARVELAVSLVASICSEHARDAGGTVLQLSICGRSFWRTTGTSQPMSLETVLAELALAEAGPAEQLPDALDEADQAVKFEARGVVISTRPTHEALEQAARGAEGANGEESPLSYLGVVLVSPELIAEYLIFEAPREAVPA
jgi:uncharacterized protein (DUF58 family)